MKGEGGRPNVHLFNTMGYIGERVENAQKNFTWFRDDPYEEEEKEKTV